MAGLEYAWVVVLGVPGRRHVSEACTVSCSLMAPYPAWSLAHLVHLEDFTLCDDWGEEVMSQLLQYSAVPVLPASLRTLRQDNLETIGCESVLKCATLEMFNVPGMRRASAGGLVGHRKHP